MCVCMCVCWCMCASVMSDSVTLWTVSHQAPLSMGFSRQKYWSELPCPLQGMVTHSSILAWEIPWTKEPGRLQSRRWKKVGHD